MFWQTAGYSTEMLHTPTLTLTLPLEDSLSIFVHFWAPFVSSCRNVRDKGTRKVGHDEIGHLAVVRILRFNEIRLAGKAKVERSPGEAPHRH